MFRRSSYCKTDSPMCVEVEIGTDGWVAVRDSKEPGSRPLEFTGDEWRAFVAGVRAGEFDL